MMFPEKIASSEDKSDFFLNWRDVFCLARTEEFWLFQSLSDPLYLKHLRKKVNLIAAASGS